MLSLLLPCLRIVGEASLTSFPLVNANGVAIRIEDNRHKAHGCFHWLDAKFGSCSFQFRNRRVEILYFQADTTAVGGWLPIGSEIGDSECSGTDIVFDPTLVLVTEDGALF